MVSLVLSFCEETCMLFCCCHIKYFNWMMFIQASCSSRRTFPRRFFLFVRYLFTFLQFQSFQKYYHQGYFLLIFKCHWTLVKYTTHTSHASVYLNTLLTISNVLLWVYLYLPSILLLIFHFDLRAKGSDISSCVTEAFLFKIDSKILNSHKTHMVVYLFFNSSKDQLLHFCGHHSR